MKHWIERMLASLILVGVIVEVQAEPLRYKVSFDNNRTSNWLIPLSLLASTEKSWCPLDVGTQVLVLTPFNKSRGFVLGALWQSAFPQPQTDLDLFSREFADGTFIQYHRVNQELFISTPGKVIGNAQNGFDITGDVTITGNVTLAGNYTQEGEMSVTGQINSDTEVIANGIKATKHKHKDVSVGTAQTGEPV